MKPIVHAYRRPWVYLGTECPKKPCPQVWAVWIDGMLWVRGRNWGEAARRFMEWFRERPLPRLPICIENASEWLAHRQK